MAFCSHGQFKLFFFAKSAFLAGPLVLRFFFDPTFEQPNDTEDDFDLEGENGNMRQQLNNMIPIYSKPAVVYCVLPGEFEYLCVRKSDSLKRLEKARMARKNVNDF